MWKMINYEICGRGHLKTNIPCQDKTLMINKGDSHVIALADGAGSASHSHYGAETVVNTISNFLIDNFDNLIANKNGVKVKEEILAIMREALLNESKKHSCAIKELASTVLAIAVKGDEFLIVHLGDGVIGFVKDDILKVASKPENGEFSNSTIFVTSGNAINYLKLYKGKTDGISGFVIMSDGTAESFYHKKSQKLSVGVKKIIDWSILLPQEKIQELLVDSFNNIVSKNTLDDCSIAILVNNKLSNLLYDNLDFSAKCSLFDINPKNSRIAHKKIVKYENLLKQLKHKSMNVSILAKSCYIKKKYLKRDIKKLQSLGIIKFENMRCYSNLKIF